MKSDFSHRRKGLKIQINDLELIYIQYSIIGFIIDVITYPKTFSTKFSTNPVPDGVLQSVDIMLECVASCVPAAVTHKFSNSSNPGAKFYYCKRLLQVTFYNSQ